MAAGHRDVPGGASSVTRRAASPSVYTGQSSIDGEESALSISRASASGRVPFPLPVIFLATFPETLREQPQPPRSMRIPRLALSPARWPCHWVATSCRSPDAPREDADPKAHSFMHTLVGTQRQPGRVPLWPQGCQANMCQRGRAGGRGAPTLPGVGPEACPSR